MLQQIRINSKFTSWLIQLNALEINNQQVWHTQPFPLEADIFSLPGGLGIFFNKSVPGSGGWAGQALPLLQAVPSRPCPRASMHRTQLCSAAQAMRPDARTRRGSWSRHRVMCVLLCCQAASGQCCWQGAPELLPACTQLLAQPRWPSCASAEPSTLSTHSTSHTAGSRDSSTQRPLPAHAPFQGCLHCKRWADLEFSLQHGISHSERCHRKHLEEAGAPHSLCSLPQGWPGNTDSQKYQGAILALQWIEHTRFRPGS